MEAGVEQRLKQLERTNAQVAEKSRESKQRCEDEWNGWFELCAPAHHIAII